MSTRNYTDDPADCPIARALTVVGDKYSLLIVREIAFGSHRFTNFAKTTGAPRDVLTSRLRRLEEAGVLTRVRYSERPERFEYHLTEMGENLRPIALALKDWGERHVDADIERVVLRHECGGEFNPVTVCSECGEPIAAGELTVETPTHPHHGDSW